MEAMVCFLSFSLIYQHELFSILFERKRKEKEKLCCGIYVQMPNFPQNPY
jgi:hypothetical protein